MRCLDIFSDLNSPCNVYMPCIWYFNVLHSAAFWNMNLSTVLIDRSWLNNYDWYSLKWFTHKYTNYRSCRYETRPVNQPALLLYILDSLPCLTSDMVTAHHHDYAWSTKWAKNICTLNTTLSSMRPHSHTQEHDRQRHLNTIRGTWKYYSTWCALLDVGFMAILRRT